MTHKKAEKQREKTLHKKPSHIYYIHTIICLYLKNK